MNCGFSTKIGEEDGSTLPAGDTMEEETGEHPTGQAMGSIPWERMGSSQWGDGVQAGDQSGGVAGAWMCSVVAGIGEDLASYQLG